MAAMPPPACRPRQAARRTRARRQQPQRPRRQGRRLVLAMPLTLIATMLPRALADTGDGVTPEASQFQVPAGASADGDTSGDTDGDTVTNQAAPPSLNAGAAVSSNDPEAEETRPLTADASQELHTQTRPAGEAAGQPATGTQDPQRPAGSPPPDAGGCTTGSGCPDVPMSPKAPPLVAAAPPNRPPEPDQPTSDDQAGGDDQPADQQPGAWVSFVLEFARDNPDYLSQFDPSELEDQLRALDEVAAWIPADSPVAADAATLRALFAAELQRRPAAETSPGETTAELSPEYIALDARAPLQGTMDPHEAARMFDQAEQALNDLDRAGQPRTTLTIQAQTLSDLLDVVHEEQLPRLRHLLGRIVVERAAHVLLDAIPPEAQAGPLPALRQSVLDQLRSDGGVQFPS